MLTSTYTRLSTAQFFKGFVPTTTPLITELGCDILFPLALDFSGWEDADSFQSKFTRLLSELDIFYRSILAKDHHHQNSNRIISGFL